MVTQQQRSDSTREKLLAAFRTSFLKRGFEQTTVQSVLTETGLSKGAMYHHFRSKSEIIEALYEHESRSAIAKVFAAPTENTSALSRLKSAYLEWTKIVKDPNIARILFEIGPAAIGEQRAREIEDTASRKSIRRLLDKAVEAGEITPPDPDLLISLLNALVAEAALYQLRSGDDAQASLELSIDGMFQAMRG
ncbi:MAG: TetR/AcrR family transcriptional regulator [Henriciella sp.]|nr:TetR/AcrR family transcriptional regulator [Henriciella sp.]